MGKASRFPRVALGAGLLLSSAPAALSQGTVAERSVSLALANEAAMATVERCRQDGHRVTAVVLDRGGNIKAVARDDGAGLHTVDSARRKAYTSLTFRIPTSTFAGRVAQTPALGSFEGVIALAGGLPIAVGDDVVGAIGVGGAPSGDADAACAQVGLDRIRARL